MGAEHQPVVVTRDGAVAVVRLNEPETLNALSPTIKQGLDQAIPGLVADPEVRAIVLTGEGRAFCAGGDIRSMDERKTVAMRRRMQASHRWLNILFACEKPIVTAVNGAAVGAGFSLALLGDLVCVAQSARFRAGFPGLGAVPDLGLAYTLPRAIGMNRAKDLLLTNRDVDAAEALAIGLAARVFDDAGLLDQSVQLAATLAAGPSVSLGLTKRLLHRAYEMSAEAFLENEAFAQTTAFGSDDFAEGVAAFRGKRRPNYRGA